MMFQHILFEAIVFNGGKNFRSDTESTENPDSRKTSENGGDRSGAAAGDSEDGKQDDTKAGGEGDEAPKSKVSMTAKMTNLFAAVKKSVKSKSDKYEQSESEAKVSAAVVSRPL